jgi:hypothetical protein
MSLQLDHDPAAKVLTVQASGKLEASDYETLAPRVEGLIRDEGKLDMLLVLRDFHGWTAGALWEDIKFDVKHFRDIRKLAVVGESKWEKGMAAFCKPFTTAAVKYFPMEQMGSARTWIGLTA